MRNPDLYAALESVFGVVGVSNPDVPGEYSVATRGSSFAKTTTTYADVQNWGECYHVNCPVCGDTRSRLYFSHLFNSSVIAAKKKIFFSKFLLKCQNENCQKYNYPELKKYLDRMGAGPFTPVPPDKTSKKLIDKIITISEVSYPSPCVDLYDVNLPGYAKDFFLKHNLDIEELRNTYRCHYVPSGAVWNNPNGDKVTFYEDRLLIPIIQRRKFVSWQARRFSDNGNPQMKYVFPNNTPKNTFLYNMDNAWKEKYCCICEGAKDAWRLGNNGVALFGKSVSMPQIEIMRDLWGMDGGAFIMLDPDAKSDAIKMKSTLDRLNVFPSGVHVVELDKDPDEYSKAELLEKMTKLVPDLQIMHQEYSDINIDYGSDEDEDIGINDNEGENEKD